MWNLLMRVCRGPAEIVGSHGDSVTSPPKSDSISSGVTEEGEIAAVLGRMLDQAGRMDTHPATQVHLLSGQRRCS